jgi:hypothetical protein
MIRSTAMVSAWLAAGGILLAGLYWLLLNTPESNLLTLTASAVLVLSMIAVAAVIVNGAIHIGQGATLGAAARRGLLGAHWFVIAAIPAIVAWLLIRRGDGWVTAHSGEISAWFIATLGWADISAIFRLEAWLSRWLRWVVFPLASLSLLSALLDRGLAGVRGPAWIKRAWSWRTLLLATLACVALLLLPWQLTLWRPALPPTWVEAAVAGLRLGAAATLIAIGGASIVIFATRPRHQPPAVLMSENPSAVRSRE